MSELRNVRHIADLIGKLERWTRNREAKQLDAEPLRQAITYLQEYRQLIDQLAVERRAAGPIRIKPRKEVTNA
jgi:hypothetical protein